MGSDPAFRTGAALVVGAVAATLAAGFCLASGDLWFGCGLIAIAAAALWRGLALMRRELSLALDQAEAFAHGDPSSTANQGRLSRLIARGVERFSADRREASAQSQFQRALLDRLSTPVLGQRADGGVIGLNAAGGRLLGAEELNIDTARALLGDAILTAFERTRQGAPPDVIDLPALSGIRRQRVAGANTTSPRGPLAVIALADIESELEAAELLAWRTQARILTHEVMNGLTPVISMAQSAAAANTDSSARETLAVLERRATQLLSFVERYRELAQPLTARRRTTDIRDVLQDAVGDMENVEMSVTPHDLRADIDPALATRAIANLLKNAREALTGREAPRLAAHAWLSDDYKLVIDVDDNGSGFSAEAAANLFQPFFTTKQTGMGIGLALARQIALAHKGSLSMTPSPLGGARLRLVL